MGKFRFTGNKVKNESAILHEIVAVIDIPGVVSKGQLGGHIEKESNISRDGSCWVHAGAVVCGNAKIEDEAQIHEHAVVKGNAQIFGNSSIQAGVVISGEAIIADTFMKGIIYVYGKTYIYGSTIKKPSDYMTVSDGKSSVTATKEGLWRNTSKITYTELAAEDEALCNFLFSRFVIGEVHS